MKILTITFLLQSLPLKSISRGCFHVLALIMIVSLLACEKVDTAKYVEKLIVSVEWGAKAGKFGLAIPTEGEIVGPRTFTIDDDGNIHIFDSIKRNIKTFNKEGVFLGSFGKDLPGYSFAVHQGHYYLLDGETVSQYTLSGIPVETYPIARNLTLYEGYGQWMRIDGYGNLYVRSQGKAYRICEGIGEKNTVLSEEAQIKSERRGTPNSSGTHWFTMAKESARCIRLRIHDKRGNLASEFPIETTDSFGSVVFIDTDAKGIIYLETKRIGKDGVIHLELRRYQVDGRLLQSVELPNSYYTIVYKKTAVDKEGTFYQLQTVPSGVKIVKWSK